MQQHLLKFNAPNQMSFYGICLGALKRLVPGSALLGSALLFVLTILAFWGNPAFSASQSYVSNVRLGAHSSYTRVVLDLSIQPDYEIFSLSSPNRIIIDLPEVAWNLPHKARKAGLVSAVRYGLYHKGRSRIVLDVASPSKLRQAFVIPATAKKPHRLVVDLVKTSNRTFQASLNKTLASRGALPNLPQQRVARAAPQPKPVAPNSVGNMRPAPQPQTLAAVSTPAQPQTQIPAPRQSRVIAPQPTAAQPIAPSPPALPASHPLALKTPAQKAQDNQPLRFVSQAQAQSTTPNLATTPDLEEPFQQALKQQIASLPDDIKPQPAPARKAVQRDPVEISPPLPSAKPKSLLPEATAPRTLTPNPAPRPAPLARKNMPVIVIDPGHGGIDPGASGAKGTREKHITLKMGKELKALLDRSGKYRVHLTRTKDEFIRLRNRFHMAEEWGAHLFISLHADSVENGYPRGASIYTLSEDSSDREAAQLAKTENKVDLLDGINLEDHDEGVQPILIDLQRRKTMELSNDFAETVVATLRRNKVRMLENAHRSAGFAVLKSPNIPSILIEMGFLSSPKEEWLLKQSSHRERIGKALVQSIDQYFFQGVGAKLLVEGDTL